MSKIIKVSPLGFGCASVMGKVGKSKSIKAMAQAYDLGVTHFDVARSYGFGLAERVLGDFIHDKRSLVTITTKFGVVPPHLSFAKKIAIPIARKLAEHIPELKAKLRSKSSVLLAEKCFDLSYAKKCLETSLRELRTDYIDFYMLHDPAWEILQKNDDLRSFLDSSVSSGKIRQWGVAYKSPDDFSLKNDLIGNVVQIEGNANNFSVIEDHDVLKFNQRFVTRPFTGGLDMSESILSLNLKNNKFISDLDIGYSDLLLWLAIELAGPYGSVVCSMFSSPHILKNINTVNMIRKDKEFRSLVHSYMNELRKAPIN